ncbi:MAG: putative Ig domain-containing protein, partial [Acidobacteria bacterium]|nr:putative Ig domain-containing protein [Acidobacteriota bacterium]
TLNAPAQSSVDAGSTLRFTVSASDPKQLATVISVSGLPSGASFDARTGSFVWTPTRAQGGLHRVTFVATNLMLLSTSREAAI